MTLSAGTRLGPYEILAPLGAGGMGEVYRARDPRLGREVAIKVLPEAVAKDRERLARFEREAQMLASLNHPNIATIHGVEDSGGAPALVMELVEDGGEPRAISPEGMPPGPGPRPAKAPSSGAPTADRSTSTDSRRRRPGSSKSTPRPAGGSSGRRLRPRIARGWSQSTTS